MFQIGVSYGSAIRRRENLSELRLWDGQLVELPLSDEAVAMRKQACGYDFRSALHIPSRELIRQMPYILDMRSDTQVDEYLQSVEAFLRRENRWEYLVAHYPILTKYTEPQIVCRLNRRYLEGLHAIAARHMVRLLIENVAVHPLCYLPDTYEQVLDLCDGICFDVGHAHTMDAVLFHRRNTHCYVADFLRQFRQNIRCVHLYNATNELAGAFSYRKHYPYLDYGVDFGFMDLDWLSQQLISLPHLEYVIHEPHRDTIDLQKRLEFGVFGCYKGESDVLFDQ